VDSKGDIFGTTDPSAQNSGGVVFEIVKTANGYDPTPTVIVNFNGMTDVGLGASLVADANGNLFGTTQTGGGANNSGTVFEITGSDFVVPPVLTAGANASYVAGAAPVALDPGLSITGLPLTGATVSIGAGLLPGDTLTVGSPQGGITSSYDAGTGVLTLSGSASRAAYQAELDSVAFASAGTLNPSSRTISWSVTDSANASAQATSSVAVFVSNPDLDIRLQNTSGQLALWQASGSTTPTLSAAALLGADAGASWFAEGSGGFFSGGALDASDILLQSTNGSVAVWQMQGATFLSGNVVANPGPNWHVASTGYFNGDSKTDIALQNNNGSVAVWEMSNGLVTQAGAVANPGPNWHVEATGDFNQDGKSDLVLQNTNGNVAIWNMNGDQISQATVVANPGPSWHVEGTGISMATARVTSCCRITMGTSPSGR
jgi:FG-GAP-like repeat